MSLGSPGNPDINFRTVQVVAGLQHTLALIAHKGKVQPYASGACVCVPRRLHAQCSLAVTQPAQQPAV